MPPKILYFDMGNVLLSFSHQRAAAQLAVVAGITAERAWEIVFDAGLQWEYERGSINCGQFHHLFCAEAGSLADREALDHAGSAIFDPLPRMLPILAALRRSGHRLGVLSNTSPSHWRYVIGRFPFLTDFFSLYALSYEAGDMKPNGAIYEAAEKMAGAAGPEIFFTDDREENVAAARSRGWDAELFTSPLELVSTLSARGIAVNY
jgi:HAD superfamily hydrolase (TIGR01509 family)